MNTLKIFVGGSPDHVRNLYKVWWDKQGGIELIGTPGIEPAGNGWKLTVWHRPMPPKPLGDGVDQSLASRSL